MFSQFHLYQRERQVQGSLQNGRPPGLVPHIQDRPRVVEVIHLEKFCAGVGPRNPNIRNHRPGLSL